MLDSTFVGVIVIEDCDSSDSELAHVVGDGSLGEGGSALVECDSELRKGWAEVVGGCCGLRCDSKVELVDLFTALGVDAKVGGGRLPMKVVSTVGESIK